MREVLDFVIHVFNTNEDIIVPSIESAVAISGR